MESQFQPNIPPLSVTPGFNRVTSGLDKSSANRFNGFLGAIPDFG
jgi:hypothetical protein